jgi:hypothetical protein
MRGMGRHTATDGSFVHPLVAEGMARRGSAAGAHRTVDGSGQRSGEVGWPAPPNKGHGLGWPGDLSVDGEEPAPRGRRRLFGTSPAA